jgi:MFS family permease
LSRLSTVLTGQLVVTIALFALYSGVLTVLLPQQVAGFAPDQKASALAAVTSVAFAVTALAQPLFGILSDRTRTRWGRRVPWVLGCGVVGAAAVAAMPAAPTLVALAVLWAVGQFVLNGADIAVSAYLVDRFPPRRRAAAAGAMGVAVVIGGVLGAVVAGARGASSGYALLAGILVAAVLGFALVIRDGPAPIAALVQPEGADPEPVRARLSLDAVWVLVSRLTFTIGCTSVNGYLLYILIDYIHVSESRALGVVGLATAVGGAGLVVAVVVAGPLSDRMGRRKPFVIAAGFAVAVGDIILLALPTEPALLVAAFLLGTGLGLAIAAGTALASMVIPRPDRNAAGGLGVLNLVVNVGQALAPLLTAAMVAVTGSYSWVFAVSGALVLAASGAAALVRSVR